MRLLETPSVLKVYSTILLQLSFDNLLINCFSQLDDYRNVVGWIFSDLRRASRPLFRLFAVFRRHSYSGTVDDEW